MDLGIKGRQAIVCAASKGLGRGCAISLAREGVNVTIIARGKEALEQTAEELRKFGVKVNAIAGDVTTPDGRSDPRSPGSTTVGRRACPRSAASGA